MRMGRIVGAALVGVVCGSGVLPAAERGPQAPVPRRSLTCMSYNIYECQWRYCKQGAPNTTAVEDIARVIRAVDPDWVGLQEVDTAAANQSEHDHTLLLSRLTGLHCEYAGSFKHRHGGEWGVAILSREKPLKVRRLQLPPVTQGPPRCALIEEFTNYVVCCTHLAAVEQERVDEARILMRELAGSTKPVFFCGDLNSRPDSRPMQALGEQFTVLTPTDEHTFPWDKPRANIDCIDYILVDTAHAPAFTVVKRNVINEPHASDHYPISVVVTY